MIVACGNTARTACSPSAFVRSETAGDFGLAPRADMWIRRITPLTLRCQRNSTGAFDVNGPIGLGSRLGKNADEVDDRTSSRDCSADGDAEFKLRPSPTKPRNTSKPICLTTSIAHGDADGRATPNKHRHQVAADKSGSAEHCNGAVHGSPSLT
jgi:hypothetical protein